LNALAASERSTSSAAVSIAGMVIASMGACWDLDELEFAIPTCLS